jgi:hypothetical protein
MAILTAATMPVVAAYDNSGEVGSSERYAMTQFNQLMKQQAALALAFTSDGVLKGTALSIGTTVTLATAQCIITIAGVPVSVPATTAQALSATLCTIKANLWGIIGIDAVAAGTISNVGVAGNATGYATEALAIAAAPAKTANKARIGYITVQAGVTDWVANTDALAGGTGGTPAAATNYYNIASPWELTADSANAITLGSIAFTASSIGAMKTTVASVITT